ncbi:MAG: 1,4-beta-xylanase, partial [Sphingobacteriaceae bacterium]
MRNIKKLLVSLLCMANYATIHAQEAVKKDTVMIAAIPQLVAGRWPVEKAHTWYNQHKWINGADFIPSTAINQLEMWQADTFDPATIDKELGWAENIGFNTM